MKHIIERLQQENLTEYQSIPFWSWNGKLEAEELVRQIHWMKENGMGGFFMHARSGLQTEYMSDEWMECIKICAKEAEKLGMHAWAYDENGWPSGFAGGKLLEDEVNRDQYILTKKGAFDSNATVSYRIEETQLVRSYQSEGEAEYLNLYIHTAVSTTDILNPEVVEQFLAATHERYQKELGDDFRNLIRGFFTDEPQYQRWATPYTKMIAKYFEEEFKEDILDGLGLLFEEKEGYRSFRYRYWKGMQSLMLQNFAKKVYDWCDEHHVKLTGHYIEETSMGMQLMCCGGVMPFYEYQHIPGIDWLGKSTNNELPPRQVASVAAQLGKKQVLTESFAGCGWQATPTDFCRVAGFQYVNGVNLMCQHLIPYEEHGNRKYDYPAHFSPINPWVREKFRDFNDYFTRLGYLLAKGVEKVNVAMLHPIRSTYFDYKREAQGFGIVELDRELKKACRILSTRNIAYHFLDETLLAKYGFVCNGKIGCGKCSYEYLVVPPIITMDQTTERLLREYVKNGGKVLLLGDKPSYREGEQYEYTYLCSNCTLQEIVDSQPYQVSNEETEIYSTCRTFEGNTYLYVINASATTSYSQTFYMGEHVKSFRKLDLLTFNEKSVPLSMTLKPGESVVLFADTKACEKTQEVIPYSLVFSKAEVSYEENYLPVDHVRYSVDGVEYSEQRPCVALFQHLLRERLEGEIYLKYEFDIEEVPEHICLRAEDCNAENAYFNGKLLTETITCDIEKNVLAYDISSMARKGINEYVVKVHWHQSEDVYYALFGENVTESLKNCIVYESELEPIYVVGKFGVYPRKAYEQEQDVRCVSADKFYIGAEPKVVSDPVVDGLPFMAGAVRMKQTICLEQTNVLLRVEGSYSTATVQVNGEKVGNLLFEKELDISAYAKKGDNEIEVRFLMDNRNLLGPLHFNMSLDSGVSPRHFHMDGAWAETTNPDYYDRYVLKKFY